MQITVIGCGYVGLVTAACFAEMGNRVACVDADEERIAALQRGVSPIYEPGIEGLLQTNQRAGRLTFHPQLGPGLSHSDVVFIAVGTPPALDGSADISQILGVAAQLGALLDSPSIVVCKSTAPVGTACRVQVILDQLCQRRGLGWQQDAGLASIQTHVGRVEDACLMLFGLVAPSLVAPGRVPVAAA